MSQMMKTRERTMQLFVKEDSKRNKDFSGVSDEQFPRAVEQLNMCMRFLCNHGLADRLNQIDLRQNLRRVPVRKPRSTNKDAAVRRECGLTPVFTKVDNSIMEELKSEGVDPVLESM